MRYLVLICMLASVIFIFIAAMVYPGGSTLDPNSVGFDWSKNFISNLFVSKALNGYDNPGRIWAAIGMSFQSLAYGWFFINMSAKICSVFWARILKYIGLANIILIVLIATPLHDLGTFSIVLTLFGLFAVTVFVLKTKLHFLKVCCILCLLTYYVFFAFYGFGILTVAVIMQKVYVISSMSLVLALEYFTNEEDFKPLQSRRIKVIDP